VVSGGCQGVIVATYNIQRGRGLDFLRRIERAIEVLTTLDTDVVGLQEVVEEPDGPRGNQPRRIADALGMHVVFHGVRPHGRGKFGVALLSKQAIRGFAYADLSVPGKEPRAALRVDLDAAHVFVCHLGLGVDERARQAELLRAFVRESRSPRIVMGDFNEWSRGSVTHALEAELGTMPLIKTHPAPAPMLPLDRIYSDAPVKTLHRVDTGIARIASDHLPLVADVAI